VRPAPSVSSCSCSCSSSLSERASCRELRRGRVAGEEDSSAGQPGSCLLAKDTLESDACGCDGCECSAFDCQRTAGALCSARLSLSASRPDLPRSELRIGITGEDGTLVCAPRADGVVGACVAKSATADEVDSEKPAGIDEDGDEDADEVEAGNGEEVRPALRRRIDLPAAESTLAAVENADSPLESSIVLCWFWCSDGTGTDARWPPL